MSIVQVLYRAASRRRSIDWNLVLVDEVRWGEDEDLAHQVRILLIAAHETDDSLARGVFDDRCEPFAHHLLEFHALLDHRLPAAPVEQGLLDARKAAPQHTDDQIVLVVGLRAGRAASVEILQQGHHPIGDRREHISMTVRVALEGTGTHPM